MENTKSKPYIIETIKEQGIKHISYRFTDLNGIWHQVTKFISEANIDEVDDILTMDGSSIAGWRGVENSDLILKPDISTFFIEPFSASPSASIICDLIDTEAKKPYKNDPRSIAKEAEKYLVSSGVGDKAFFGVEPEFFVFDKVKYKVSNTECFFNITSSEMEKESEKESSDGSFALKMGAKGGYHAVPTLDQIFDIRSEILSVMEEIGMRPMLHHHEVGQSQCEVGFYFDTLINTADGTQKCKYVVKNVASSFGKSASFMAKPIYGENGSGMHVHQSIWKDGKNIFAGSEYSGLSEIAINYIAGILRFARSIAAFSNPTINSYRRLVPGFEAPTTLTYSAKNSSAGIRIPYSEGDKAARIEARFPDPTSNPYLMLSALLMAGIYGIKNKLEPNPPSDENLYKVRDDTIKVLPSSLEEALKSLEDEHDFLLEGGVFTKDFIKSYIALKRKDVLEMMQIPHPLEFKMYYGF